MLRTEVKTKSYEAKLDHNEVLLHPNQRTYQRFEERKNLTGFSCRAPLGKARNVCEQHSRVGIKLGDLIFFWFGNDVVFLVAVTVAFNVFAVRLLWHFLSFDWL